jgi:hypothetical protein
MALGLSLYATALADSFFQPGGITPVFCRSRTFRSEVAKFVRAPEEALSRVVVTGGYYGWPG